MTIPLQVTFRDMDTSDALHATIRNHAAKLAHFSDNILSCHVVVRPVEKCDGTGSHYHIHIHVKIPWKNNILFGPAVEKRAPEDAEVAVRGTFNAMRRRLGDFVRVNRADVRRCALPPPI